MTNEETKLAKTILPKDSRLFAVMAEIEKLRREIEEQAHLLAAA